MLKTGMDMGTDMDNDQKLWARAQNYVLSRQSADGGFCFYRVWGVEESTAPDTYYAIAVLRFWGMAIPHRAEMIRWLQSLQDDQGQYSSLTNASFGVRALSLLADTPLCDPRPHLLNWATQAAGHKKAANSETLRDWQRCVQLQRMLAPDEPLPEIMRSGAEAILHGMEAAAGGFGSHPNLVDSGIAWALQRLLGQPLRPQDRIFLHACEDATLGLRLSPDGASTRLEAIFWGILQMAHLHIAPRYPEAVMAYVRACQPVNGGFGRRAGAIATLEGTFHAVMIAAGLSRNPLLQTLTGI
ncbi:MAG: prenyltransferase/squalene oxidase repeat-containing protein [Candidatus Pacebacteria bacterium]|nr:prenyltransferase/squalene oxidase repeat-containing protein [Candidatus Paceibacterota bacterium]